MTSKLAIIILLFSIPHKTFAQSDSTIELSTITIQENRLETPFSELARSVQVITKEELATLPVQSVAEALSYISGVDLRQRGILGIQTDISIRGGTFEQTLILLNGVKISDPQTGHHSFNLPVSMESIERIEVIKGPAARIYGQNAFSGAINIITKVPKKKAVSLKGYGGDFGTFGGHAGVALPSKIYGQYVSVNHDRSDGYRKNADFNLTNLFYQSYLKALGGTFNAIIGNTYRKFGAAGFYVPNSEEFEKVNTGFVTLNYEKKLNQLTIKPRVYWRRNHDDYVFIRSDPDFYHNLHTTHVYGAEINTSYSSKLGLTGLGAEYRKEKIESTNLGDHARTIAGIFAEHRFYWFNRLDVTPGIYLNWYSDYGWNYFPGVDASLEITDNLKLFGNIGKSFRIPTFTDLYYAGPANIGNSELEPESAISYEGGFKWFQKGFWGQLSYFKRDASKLIDWVRITDQEPWRPDNFYKVNTEGFEGNLTFNFQELIATSFILQRFFINYTYLNVELPVPDGVQSHYALENLKHQLVMGADHKIYKNIYHSFRFRHTDRVTLSDYRILDSRIYYKKHNLNVFAEATNFTNTQYKEAGFVQMPGRWFRAGVDVTLDLEKK